MLACPPGRLLEVGGADYANGPRKPRAPWSKTASKACDPGGEMALDQSDKLRQFVE